MVSAHVDSMGFKVKTANWKTSLKGEAKAGAGGGCDPQKPPVPLTPELFYTQNWLWKHHSKRDKRLQPFSCPRGEGLSCGKHYPGTAVQSRREEAPAKRWESAGVSLWRVQKQGGAAWERPTWSQAQQCLSPGLWLITQGTGMDWMGCLEIDIQVATSTHPQGHPHGDPAACRELFWVECVACGSFPQGGGGEEAPTTHLLWRERWRAQNCRGNPETLKKSRNWWKAMKVSWCCPTWLDIQRVVLPLPD